MPEIASLSVKIDADTSAAESGLARLNQQVSGTGSAIAAAFGTAAVAGVAALGAGLVGSIKSAADFEKQMSAIGAVAGATTGEMKQLSDLTLQLGKDTSFSATEAAKGVEELIKAGVSIGDVSGGAARAVLDLSAASGTAVAESARIMSNAMNVFKDSGLTAEQAANILAGASNASATSVHELGNAMAASGGVASMLGFTFEETSTALAMFADAGLRGSDAGTSFKTMMMNLIPQTNKEKDLMRELGLVTQDVQRGLEGAAKLGIVPATQDITGLNAAILESMGVTNPNIALTKKQQTEYEKLSTAIGLTKNEFFKIDGTIKPLGEVFDTLKNSLAGMTREQQISAIMTIFGTDATRAAAIANKMGSAGVVEMTEKMRKQGDAQKIANERLNNLAGSWEKFTGSVETGGIILGSIFLPALKGAVDGMTDFANQAIDAIEQIPDAIETVKQVLAGEWAPADSIRPFTNEVGKAAIVLRDTFGPAVQAVSGFVTGTLIPAIQRFAAPLAAFAAGFGGTIVTLGLASVAISAVATVLGLLLSPLGLVAIAVGALAAAWTVNFGGIQQKVAEFVEIVQRALGGDVAGAFQQFIALVKATATEIGTQLLLWGQAFIDWVAPMIPPFLAAVADIGLQFIAWIAAQIPLIAAQLLLWAQQFVAWVAPFIPPLLAALATAAVALLGWIAQQIPPIIAQLVLWAAEFVAWVAPFIPPLLAALATVAAALLKWTAAQIPPIIAQLLLWGAEFVAWVAPQIPGLLSELGKLILALWDWQIAQVPGITAKLVEWGILFGVWVGTTAIPELIKALPGIVTTIGAWVETAKVEIGQRLVALGAAIVTGIFNGFTAAWATIGPQIMAAIANAFRIPDIRMPSLQWGTGSGLQTQSYSGGAGSEEKLSRAHQIAIGKGFSEDQANAMLGTLRVEGGLQGAVNTSDPGGSYGPFQLNAFGQLPNFAKWLGVTLEEAKGAANDLELATNFALDTYYGQSLRTGSAAGLSGPALATYAQTHAQVSINPEKAGAAYGPPAGGVPAQKPMVNAPMTRIPLSGAPGASPEQWPGFMNQVEEQLPAYLTSLETIQGKGAQTFTQTAQAGVAQAGVLSTGVTAQYDLMANKVQGTVTSLGAGTMTSLKDAAGTSVVTITDMSGAITSQYATMASGVSITMGTLGTTTTSTVDAFTGHITTTMTDAMGNVVTTVTSQTGAVISQFGTMATDVIASQTDLSTQVVGINAATGETVIAQNTAANEALVTNNNQMHSKKISDDTNAAGITVARYQETSGAIVTIVTDQNGKVLADFTTSAQDIGKVTTDSNTRRLSETTNALGQTVTVYREASGAIVTLVTDTAGKTVAQFSNVGTSAKTMADTVRTAGKAFGEMPPPNMSAHVAQLKSATNAALAYQKALVAAAKASEDLAGKPGGKKGDSKELAKRHTGGPVDAFMPYLVGAPGAEELFVPDRAGNIYSGKLQTPATSGGRGGGTETVVFVIRDPDGRTLAEYYVKGRDMATRRGRN